MAVRTSQPHGVRAENDDKIQEDEEAAKIQEEKLSH